MGLLDIFSKPAPEQPTSGMAKLPSGSLTIDKDGKIITSTIPRSFAESHLHDISSHVLETFRSAREVQLTVGEIMLQYAAFKVTARELRGGAIIFLAPQSLKK